MAAINVSWPDLDVRHGDRTPRVSHNSDGTVVWLDGDQDIATVRVLAETLARTIAFQDTDVIVDLSAVQFIDAATMTVLIRGRRILRRQSRA